MGWKVHRAAPASAHPESMCAYAGQDILALPKEAWAPRSADQDDRGHRWRTELDLLPPWLELPDQGQGRRRESSPAWRTGAAEHFIKAWTHAFGSLTQDQQRMYQEQFPAPPGEWRNWYAALEQYTVRRVRRVASVRSLIARPGRGTRAREQKGC